MLRRKRCGADLTENMTPIYFKERLVVLNWQEHDNESNPEKLWEILNSNIRKVLDIMCPIKKMVIPEKKPKWLNNELIELMRDRDAYYSRARQTEDIDSWNIARFLRNRVQQAIKAYKTEKITEGLDKYKGNPRKFWEYIRDVLPSSKAGSFNILYDSASRTIQKQDLPEHINDYFTCIGPELAAKQHKGSLMSIGNSNITRVV